MSYAAPAQSAAWFVTTRSVVTRSADGSDEYSRAAGGFIVRGQVAMVDKSSGLQFETG